MRRTAILLLAATAMLGAAAVPIIGAAAPARPASADAQFVALSKRYIDSIARFQPAYGTQLGDHRFDDRLPDITAAGRGRQIVFDQSLLSNLRQIDFKALSRDNQVDCLLLKNALDFDLWDLQVLKSWSWNAQNYNDAAAGALYTLAARDFAPWPRRFKAATARMEALPAFLLESRRQLVAAKVPAIYATTVSKQNSGIVEIAEGMLAPHASELSGADRARFDGALARLKAAVADQQIWLDKTLVPAAKGDFRLGARLYDQKMKFALVSDITRAELKAKATAAAAATRAQMYDLARQALNDPSLPGAPTQAQQQKAIEAALDLTYAKRPPRDGVEAAAKAALASASDFARAKGLVTMPTAPVKIITMPKFQQGNAVAYCDSPGPLDKGQDTFFAISPIPDDWSDAQATSFLREYNDYMIHDLSIHEAMPGHWLQIDHANQDKSVLRAVLSSGPFVEGWAVYGEGMMADQGYLNGDPLFKLTVLKMRLRSITNTLLDIGIQTEGMTRDQAMDLMMKGAFQQEREAAGKWVRASLSSTQLLSYFSGYEEHMAMREEARRRWGARFDLKTYNDAVLAHGSPPARFVRELVFGLPIE
ncbi:DUF885 domain-containing protein [Sphingomonas sp.]|jgi:uncharacterized protein (DUF885 family)|uniref:DUF885 domain-containing protein n=1 Tax=Sphingomonas sp. TaxID=28214 RepID=UPI002E35922C|nr:DUF885 domain-containing protein [Sphingomonas sp.]HEX4694827.1 DUF885 domain-containing protein [Sphingomonas sp.]